MGWFGLGKKRSVLGKWLDRKGIDQLDVEKKSGLSRGTVSKACNDDDYTPKHETAQKILRALKKLSNENVKYDDFWQM
jgi:transcriptional regulator with XRE-family HTH domain